MVPGCANLILALVDDDQAVRRAVGRLLRSCGYEVHVFESAEAYLARDCNADCAIVDIQLSGMSGLELEGRLRQAGRCTPVIFITGQDDAAICATVEELRVPFLKKPFDEAVLLDAIARATASREPRSEGVPTGVM